MAIIRCRIKRRRVPPVTNTVRRVPCSRSVPNRTNSHPVKKGLFAPQTSHDQEIFSAEGDDSDLQDTLPQNSTAETNLAVKRAHNSSETDFTAGVKSEVQKMSRQDANFSAAMNHFSAEGNQSYVPDTYAHYDGAEGSNDIEVFSEGVSEVRKLTCRVCKSADVSVAIVPCRQLCLCLDCDPKTDKCPVCGDPKTSCFYTR